MSPALLSHHSVNTGVAMQHKWPSPTLDHALSARALFPYMLIRLEMNITLSLTNPHPKHYPSLPQVGERFREGVATLNSSHTHPTPHSLP